MRGDVGVLGDDQPSVLIVFVGDKGGVVVYPDSEGHDSSSVVYIAGRTEGSCREVHDQTRYMSSSDGEMYD